MNSNQAQYLLKCASGLQKSSVLKLPQASKWWDSPEARALIGGGVGGLLGGGAGYLLSDDDRKGSGLVAGGLVGTGVGATVPAELIERISNLLHRGTWSPHRIEEINA